MSTLSPTIIKDASSKFITVAAGKNYANKGLLDAKVGFANGIVADPTYKRVCEGDTEFLQISYDPAKVSLKELISFFYKIHDPTTVNSQGADTGTQYRSAIFYHNEDDLKIIDQVTKEFEPKWGNKIVTKIEPIKNFYDAEDYHQLYLDKNPEGYHCPTHFVRDL
ncbi:hypothetical protein WICMUC_001950 [Wickerhamomyces mucosus]|uniref:peptide-methionine (S)-S-oxide reductase n=1 Tax=Wickerhamomyces mucosus TaxID=1378264 RepID=A0A9P8TFN0_9ASCO|nr:hypothetical protein WICMUC_001950 [Wickerhamomyces mucosus]